MGVAQEAKRTIEAAKPRRRNHLGENKVELYMR
jgi:hypothetical protein